MPIFSPVDYHVSNHRCVKPFAQTTDEHNKLSQIPTAVNFKSSENIFSRNNNRIEQAH